MIKLHQSILLACIVLITACSNSKSMVTHTPNHTINLALAKTPMANKYVNLDYGIRLNVQDGRANTRIVQKYDASATSLPKVNTNPLVMEFVPESMRRYMCTIGFNLDADIQTDYMMQVTLKEFHTDYLSGIGWQGTVYINIEVYDQDRTLVYPNITIIGRASNRGSATDFDEATVAMNNAYYNALEDIDWDRIAFFLHRASSPKQEANKHVNGQGNTALEHLTIHWNIESRPQGADISWRVISSNPNVKNQNYRYLNTTPYESTETFDIKGLTYNNAGDVQIEIKCEKTGYYTNSKKFNVLSIIDEKEISAFFRLVKEEEE